MGSKRTNEPIIHKNWLHILSFSELTQNIHKQIQVSKTVMKSKSIENDMNELTGAKLILRRLLVIPLASLILMMRHDISSSTPISPHFVFMSCKYIGSDLLP